MQPDFSKMDALIATAPTSQIVTMARRLQADLSDEATMVMGRLLAELANRVDEDDFLVIIADLDDRLADQAAKADPMHY